MKQISHLYNRISALRGNKGFTMIELLIVIAILGILAVAVLSAINPLEQINRGRDTGKQSDAEQIIGAVERFNAFQGHYPWDADPTVESTPVDPAVGIANGSGTGANPMAEWLVDDFTADETCTVIDRLGAGIDGGDTTSTCQVGASELKPSFINRVSNYGNARGLYFFKATAEADSDIYVCFSPQSQAFKQAAQTRCDTENYNENDYPIDFACGDGAGAYEAPNPEQETMVCLP